MNIEIPEEFIKEVCKRAIDNQVGNMVKDITRPRVEKAIDSAIKGLQDDIVHNLRASLTTVIRDPEFQTKMIATLIERMAESVAGRLAGYQGTAIAKEILTRTDFLPVVRERFIESVKTIQGSDFSIKDEKTNG